MTTLLWVLAGVSALILLWLNVAAVAVLIHIYRNRQEHEEWRRVHEFELR